MLKLDLVHTLAAAGVVLFMGQGLRRLFPWLSRYNIPGPVVGGLLVAAAISVARHQGITLVEFDTTLQAPLMTAFFTSVGFGASFRLLRVGGPQVMLFFLLATVLAVAQNVLGALLSLPFGLPPLFGVLAGSVALTGGPGTGLAFAPAFEQAGVSGASTLAVAAAMLGIVSGGVLGGPISTYLVQRHRLASAPVDPRGAAPGDAGGAAPEPAGDEARAQAILKSLVVLLVAMWLGSWVSRGFAALGVTLPSYIGAMVVAALIRNLDDRTGLVGLSQSMVDALGSVALSLFLALALTTLRLWELVNVAVPLVVMVAAQVALMTVVALGPVFRLMGRDYDAAVMSGGFMGFMLGTTANAMANMEAVVEKHGPAPRAYLVVPMVGACFIDFTNAVIITACLNLLR